VKTTQETRRKGDKETDEAVEAEPIRVGRDSAAAVKTKEEEEEEEQEEEQEEEEGDAER
jgi:hypothetical protein